MGVFSKDESAPQESKPKASSKKRKPVTSRSSQYVAPAPRPTGIASAFFNSPSSVAYNTPRSMTAAAAQVKMNDKGEFEQFKNHRSASSSAWQAEAWEYYDAIGEIKYAFNLVASVVSRIRIFAAAVDDPAQAPVPVNESRVVDPTLAAAA